MHDDSGHTVTGSPAGRPAHAERPVPGRRWPWLVAALLAVAAAGVAWLLLTGDPVTSAPTSARTLTATSAPPP